VLNCDSITLKKAQKGVAFANMQKFMSFPPKRLRKMTHVIKAAWHIPAMKSEARTVHNAVEGSPLAG